MDPSYRRLLVPGYLVHGPESASRMMNPTRLPKTMANLEVETYMDTNAFEQSWTALTDKRNHIEQASRADTK